MPWIVALAGAAIILVIGLYAVRTGLAGIRISHAAGLAIGLALLAAGYWAWRLTSGRLQGRDLPLVVVSVLVLMALPIPVLFIGKQAELHQRLAQLNERLERIDARVYAIGGRPQRSSFGCGPANPMVRPAVAWREVVSGLSKPVGLTHAGDGSGRKFVVEKGGSIRIVRGGTLQPIPFLDIREIVRSDDMEGEYVTWEEGLLGLAFAPDFGESGRFYVAFSARPDGRTVLAEYRTSSTDPDRADPASAREILSFPQLGGNHNSGQLAFGPDSLLYLGVGDGGFEGEHGDDPNREAQRLDRVYGKILRIDVRSGDPYSIPPDNPFADEENARPEIFALGFRNPWRFSFDPCDGALLSGDVGRTGWEEVNLVVAGGNYGWPLMEGYDCFWRDRRCNREGLSIPIFAYPHLHRDPAGGGSAIGGYVYRGSRYPSLRGYYFFADFLSTQLFSLAQDFGNPGHWIVGDLGRLEFPVSSFGVDEEREIYLVDYRGRILQLTSAEG